MLHSLPNFDYRTRIKGAGQTSEGSVSSARFQQLQFLAMDMKRNLHAKVLQAVVLVFGLVILVANISGGSRDTVQDEVPVIRLVETLRIGDETHEDGVIFGDIGGLVAVDSKGRIFVGERQDPQIYAFTSGGEFMRSIGEEGAGPGEFSRLSGVRIGPGDSLYAFDSRAKRISAFHPASLDLVYSMIVAEDKDSRPPRDLIGVHEEGFLVTYEDLPWPDTDFETERFMFLRTVTRNGQPAEKHMAQVPSSKFMMVQTGDRFIGVAMPYSPHPVIHVAPDGHVYSGSTESIAVSVRAISGEERGFIRHTTEPIPITGSELNEWMEILSEDAAELLRKSDLRETKPACSTFVADDQGRIWVRRTSEDFEATNTQWLVLDARSRVAGEVALPSSVTLELVVGRTAYAVDEGDEGLTLVIYAVAE